MSAEMLRRAATGMREEGGDFLPATADWLDMFAAVKESGNACAFEDQALAVARAYLGESR